MNFVFAKKCVLPTGAANVLQSLNMAAAFSRAGADMSFFPGIKGNNGAERDALFRTALNDLGVDPPLAGGWDLLPGSHAGFYGARFRLKMAALRFASPGAVFYARDIKEASCIRRLLALPGRKHRFVFEMHEVLHRQAQNAAQKERLRREEAAVLRAAHGLVALTPSLGDMARDIFGYSGPVLVEPSAYNPAVFKPVDLFSAGSRWPGEEDDVQLVYLGRFHQGKGVENLVAAMEFLPLRVRLRIIGGSPADRYAALKAAAAAIPGGGARISFTGTLPQKDAAKAVAGAHIFVIPQEDGGVFFSPLKLYEALALGVPVLTTPLGVFAEQEAAGLVAAAPGTGPEDIAEGVMRLVRDGEKARSLREKGLAAAKTATWQARAERILAFCAGLSA
ncbi:hypothetical protein KL86DPRO_10108 [uncultured delta proteobacterium]|uniref:Glycosyl transferase group 1 n=1 Tax=uncultured delta proteobacterium TaxID=34034 RepID=A0A212IUM6_9DELT|nr:hypothetical protein KL86DPRO_10108 [uncultured delta proteobacterium]